MGKAVLPKQNVDALAEDHYLIVAGDFTVEIDAARWKGSDIHAKVKVVKAGRTVALDSLNLTKASARRRFIEDATRNGHELPEDVLIWLGLAAEQGLPKGVRDGEGRDAEKGALQGQEITFEDLEPWPEPVNGAAVLDLLLGLLTRFVILPDGAAHAVVLWIAHTYLMDVWQISPFLTVNSPVKQCGKTTLLRLLKRLTYRGYPTSSITEASLYRLIAKSSPTLIIDEAENCINDKDSPLYGVLNAGHTRDTAQVVRTVGDDHEPRQFSTWAPKVVALIGTLRDTAMDRSVVIPMRRKRPSESMSRLRQAELVQFEAECRPIRQQLIRFTQDVLDECARRMPTIPDTLRDRDADNWFPLFVIAEIAGGTWAGRALHAAAELTGTESVDDSPGMQLLRDCHTIAADSDNDSIQSRKLVEALNKMEPWKDYHGGKGITSTFVSRKLKPFGVVPAGTLRFGIDTDKGYRWASFEDAWFRYLQLKPSHRNNLNNDGPELTGWKSHSPETVTDAKTLVSSIGMGVVTPVTVPPTVVWELPQQTVSSRVGRRAHSSTMVTGDGERFSN